MKKLLMSLAVLIALSFSLSAQNTDGKKLGFPVQKQRLIKALLAHQFTEEAIVGEISRSGVDFELTPDVERELKTAGATLDMLKAAGQSYRMLMVGVINGRASKIASPTYPKAAHDARVGGSVNVLVTIDEEGNVIDANAIKGDPLLREAAEKAALASKFSPTLLKDKKVKIAGVMVYVFTLR